MNFSSPVHSTAVNHFCSVFQSFVSFISSIFISNISLVCLLHIDNILTCLLGVIITFILNSYPIPSNNCAPLVWFVACLLHCTFQAYGYFGCESRLAPEQRTLESTFLVFSGHLLIPILHMYEMNEADNPSRKSRGSEVKHIF